jgi:hypothetical protein
LDVVYIIITGKEMGTPTLRAIPALPRQASGYVPQGTCRASERFTPESFYPYNISGPNLMVTASTGQSRRHDPQCQHSSGYCTIGISLPSSKRITSTGQCASQVPHPVHLSKSITGGMIRSFLHGALLLFRNQGIVELLKGSFDPLACLLNHNLTIKLSLGLGIIRPVVVDAEPRLRSCE